MGEVKVRWKKVRLGEVCEKVNYGYTASAEYSRVGPKFLRITDIVLENIDWDKVPYCQIEEKNIPKFLLKEGDIVIARTGATVGYAKYIKKGIPTAVFASYLVRIRLKKDCDARYIGFLIESDIYKRFIKANISGAAQPQANAQVLTSYPAPIAPLNVQRKIAAILSAYDDLIENNTRRIQILEEMAQTFYKEWFVKFRFPGYEKVKLVDSDLGKIPEGWVVKRFGDVCNIVMGQSPSSKFYNTNGEGLPFHQGVKDFGTRFPTHKTYCTVDKRVADGGDVLVSVRAPVGRINIANSKLIVGRGLAAIRHESLLQSFLFYQLKNIFVDEDSMGGGSIFNAITKEDMSNIKFLVPNESLDRKFDELIGSLDKQIEKLQSQIENIRRTRGLLLPKLISGVINVETLEIEYEN
jgi:type I restriction enzyme S subunit